MSLLERAKTILRDASFKILREVSIDRELDQDDYESIFIGHSYVLHAITSSNTLDELIKKVVDNEFYDIRIHRGNAKEFLTELANVCLEEEMEELIKMKAYLN